MHLVHLVREDRRGAKAIPATKEIVATKGRPAIEGRPASVAVKGRPARRAIVAVQGIPAKKAIVAIKGQPAPQGQDLKDSMCQNLRFRSRRGMMSCHRSARQPAALLPLLGPARPLWRAIR